MKILIQNIKQGLSRFSEQVKPDFVNDDLAHYYPEIFHVDVLLDRFDQDYRVKVNLKSRAWYVCDRCLEMFVSEINLKQEQIYKSGAVEVEIKDEIVPLPVDATEIDLTEFLNEAVIINHPIKMLCKTECKGICPGCGLNLNENECACDAAGSDPRWDELRRLIK